jgi:hypothetical protein
LSEKRPEVVRQRLFGGLTGNTTAFTILILGWRGNGIQVNGLTGALKASLAIGAVQFGIVLFWGLLFL